MKKVLPPRTNRALKPLKDALLWHVFEQLEQGINVGTFDLAVKASTISPKFNAKSFAVGVSAVRQFMQAHSLVSHMGTHELRGDGFHVDDASHPQGTTS